MVSLRMLRGLLLFILKVFEKLAVFLNLHIFFLSLDLTFPLKDVFCLISVLVRRSVMLEKTFLKCRLPAVPDFP